MALLPAGLRLLLVAATTVLTVADAALLRADSAGDVLSPQAATALAVPVAVALWHLLTRVRSGRALLAGALLVQVGAQILAQAGAVGAQGPWRDAVCCPPSAAPQDASLLSLLTAGAGGLLLVAQLVVAALVALSLRSVQALAADTARCVVAVVRSWGQALCAALLLVAAAAVTLVPPGRPRVHPRRTRPHVPLLPDRSVTRRGPPRRAALQPFPFVLPSPCGVPAS